MGAFLAEAEVDPIGKFFLGNATLECWVLTSSQGSSQPPTS